MASTGDQQSPMKMVQMFLPMAILWGCQKYQIEESGYINHIRAVYLLVNLVSLGLLGYITYRIRAGPGALVELPVVETEKDDASGGKKVDKKSAATGKKDVGTTSSSTATTSVPTSLDEYGRPLVTVSAVVVMGQERTSAKTVTVAEYDAQQVWEEVKKIGMGLGILCCIHCYWGVMMPLILQSVMVPLQMVQAPLFEIYLLGKKDVERPFRAAPSPFAEVAERWKEAQKGFQGTGDATTEEPKEGGEDEKQKKIEGKKDK